MEQQIKKRKAVFVGVGGQGVLMATKILGDAFTRKKIVALMSEIHGMAQRGGIVECSLAWGGKLPESKSPEEFLYASQEVYSPVVGTGEADIGVGLELLESYRAQRYYSSNSIVLVNTRKIVPPMVSMGYGRYPDPEKMLEELRSRVKVLIAFNASDIATKAGTERATNIVMLGALWRTYMLPLTEEELWQAIERNIPKKAIEINRIAFKEGQKVVENMISSGEIKL